MIRIYERLLVAAFNAADVPRKVTRRGLEVACILRAYVPSTMRGWVPKEGSANGEMRPMTGKECAASAVDDGLALADAIRGRR